ncbi:Mu-like prophage protein gp36 [Bosea sp. CRIB-10]|uniref:DUF1320 domain-containing protein n=1 Tax=Bosea sp. CRIB-10 TaxID=378404 RepID=UPI0008EA54CE|nr:DUF1320 domain-containing protein [Bosea sp. CRIB-10]SFD76369.1 Mu-like prophage protein gp36 [Bosea sp. CRIB-10]
MTYATRADIEAIYGASHLATLVAHDVDLDVAVGRALDAAARQMEPYLRKRYRLPLPAGASQMLMQCAIDIACWQLAPAGDRISEQIEKRAKLRLEFLRELAAGKVDLVELDTYLLQPAAEGTVSEGSTSGASFSADQRRWPAGGDML